jgi:hypothetical protein
MKLAEGGFKLKIKNAKLKMRKRETTRGTGNPVGQTRSNRIQPNMARCRPTGTMVPASNGTFLLPSAGDRFKLLHP